MGGAKYKEIMNGNLVEAGENFRMWRMLIFQQDNDAKYRASGTVEWFHVKALKSKVHT